MSQDYGIQVPDPHTAAAPSAEPARYLVQIDAGTGTVARLFLADRTEVAQFDAGSQEVALMVEGLEPTEDAGDPAWDDALGGHSAEQRRAARVYRLDV